jgi:hypothetical protein
VLLLHCIQLLNSGWSAIPVKCVIVWFSFYSLCFFFQLKNFFFPIEYVSRKFWSPSLARSYSTRLLSVWSSASAVYRDRPHTFNELKTAITACIRNISQADLQKVFAKKIKRVQSCIDARRHHFQHLLISAQRLSERTLYESHSGMCDISWKEKRIALYIKEFL